MKKTGGAHCRASHILVPYRISHGEQPQKVEMYREITDIWTELALLTSGMVAG